MRLTRKKAIEISIELWTWLAETGKECKHSWPGWEKYVHMSNYCPLCEYVGRKCRDEAFCSSCPYYKVFGYCILGYYDKWYNAETIGNRMKYATMFLEQLKQL